MKSKRFTQKRKKGGMFPRTRRKGNSPTTAFAFSLPSENESLKQ